MEHREWTREYITHGMFLSATLFLTYLCQTLVFQQYFNFNSTVELLVRSSLISRVYEKSCRLSPQSRSQYTSGQIQNLMSNDSRAVAEVVLYLHMLWSSIEQITVAMILIVQLLGLIPTLSGVLFLLFAVPVQSFLVAAVRNCRERASSHTDERVKIVSELIKGIKLVKLYAWELSFVKHVLGRRALELDELRKMVILQAWSSLCYMALPTVLTLVVFTTFVIMGNELDAAIVFPAITLFNVLRPAMIILPYVLVNAARAAASLSRLQKFLTAEELVPLDQGEHAIDQELLRQGDLDIAAVDAAFSWDPSIPGARPSLSSVSLSIPQGSLVAIVGPTGAGKSTLLAGLLSEVPIVSGKAGFLKGRSIAFCDQVAFIQNATVRENILFGKPYDEHHYNEALRVSCLGPDLEILTAGDQTEIGGRGINLSGGQRARVSLARAVYARSDIYIFDDPLSAVDAHVGNTIFKECITKALRGKTRILSTNQVQFASSHEVDIIIVVKDGAVVECNERRILASNPDSEFAKLLRLSGELTGGREQSSEIEAPNGSSSDLNGNLNDAGKIQEGADSSSTKQAGDKAVTTTDYGAAEAGKLTDRESKEQGRVKLIQYKHYMMAMGLKWVIPIFVLSTLYNGLLLGLNVWLSIWSDISKDGDSNVWLHLFIFLVLGLASVLCSGLGSVCNAFGSIRASVIMHEKLLFSVLGAPSSFFNSTPDGRLINRFTSDMDKIDQSIAFSLQAIIRLWISLSFTLCLVLWATPGFIVVALPIIFFCVYVQEFYRKSSVDLRRLEALARSPLYSHFGETLDGVVTLRAYGGIPRSTHISHVYTDNLNRTMYATAYANRWLAIRLEGLGTLLILGASSLAILSSPDKLSASMVGLVLTYTMQILGTMTWSVRQFTDTESQMSAVERLTEYSEPPFPQEEKGGLEGLLQELQKKTTAAWKNSQGLISEDKVVQLNENVGNRKTRWPKRGLVEFDQVEMRYRKDLPPALRNLSFTVKPGEHIGIVGRTGAGKSSAIQCLFRLYELEKGRILIDGSDVSKMRLHHLRSSLGVIPQEPVCFSGTIRSNLDMFGECEDDEIQRALNDCGLQGTMREIVTLDDEVAENGSNLSVGQRQLLCLGRALLKDSQVLILDEATSNVSNEVDEKIQETLRNAMNHCTILTVAHRLHTVMRSDRIIVMDNGRIGEMGKPSELLSGPSMLGSLVDETGPSTAAYLRQLASNGNHGQGRDCRDNGTDGSGQRLEPSFLKIGSGNTSFELGSIDSPNLREVANSVFGNLRSALSGMNLVEVEREITRLAGHDGPWRELFVSVIDRLSYITGANELNGVTLDLASADVHSGSQEAAAGILQSGVSPRGRGSIGNDEEHI